MADNGDAQAALSAEIEVAQEAVSRQGDIVRGLKAEVKDGKVVRVRYTRQFVLMRRARIFALHLGLITHGHLRLQAAVDDALDKLKQLKLELDAKLKVGAAQPPARNSHCADCRRHRSALPPAAALD